MDFPTRLAKISDSMRACEYIGLDFVDLIDDVVVARYSDFSFCFYTDVRFENGKCKLTVGHFGYDDLLECSRAVTQYLLDKNKPVHQKWWDRVPEEVTE